VCEDDATTHERLRNKAHIKRRKIQELIDEMAECMVGR